MPISARRPFRQRCTMTLPAAPLRIHATCVALDGRGVLLRGPSAAGKSDLALRLIDGGAVLVADDQVLLDASNGVLYARSPENIAGLLEVRGVGIVPVPHAPQCAVALVVDLVAHDEIDRLPEPQSCTLAGVPLPLLALNPFEASAAAKLRLALRLPRRS